MKRVAEKLGLRNNKGKSDPSDSATPRASSVSKPAEDPPLQPGISQPLPTAPRKASTSKVEAITTTMSSQLPKTFKAAVLNGVDKPLEIKELPMPEVKPGEILLKVEACGVCHSDHHVQHGDMGPHGIEILGHEYVGHVVAVADGEKKWKVGDRVGGAWHGGHDGSCRSCSRGEFQMCDNKTINGVMRNGGYGTYATLRSEAAVSIPKDADAAEVAPLLCAGVTVFNGIRQLNIRSGEVVAVQGLGGLGHLAIQYFRKMGFRTVALSRGSTKKDFAMKLGANDYIDTQAEDVGEALQKLGGAACIV